MLYWKEYGVEPRSTTVNGVVMLWFVSRDSQRSSRNAKKRVPTWIVEVDEGVVLEVGTDPR